MSIPEAIDTTGCDIVVQEIENGQTELTILSEDAAKFFMDKVEEAPKELLTKNDIIILDVDIMHFLGEVVPQSWVCGVVLDDDTLSYIKPNTTH